MPYPPEDVTGVNAVAAVPCVSVVVGTDVAAVRLGRYVKAEFAAFVPPGVVRLTLAFPIVPDGVLKLIVDAFTSVKFEAADPPTVTSLTFSKPVPETMTAVPPAAGPEAGVIDEKTGAVTYVYSRLELLLPPGVATTTAANPAVPAGTITVIVVELTTVTLVAEVPPIVTLVAPANAVPVIVTAVPPAAGPMAGLMVVTLARAE